jgi:putative transposase
LVYRSEKGKEVFLARAYAQDLETEELSLDEAKASSKKIREAGKTISNRSILAEVQERETFLSQKKTKKERQKQEQAQVRKVKQPLPVEPEEIAEVSVPNEAEPEMPEVFDYDQMREDYGW